MGIHCSEKSEYVYLSCIYIKYFIYYVLNRIVEYRSKYTKIAELNQHVLVKDNQSKDGLKEFNRANNYKLFVKNDHSVFCSIKITSYVLCF